MSRTVLLSPAQAERTLNRLAYEIVERNRGVDSLELMGIKSRGVALAHRLADMISEIGGMAVPSHAVDVSPFRDDLEEPIPVVPINPPPSVAGRNVILVDDVLFTGRTAKAGMDAILHYGRPASIQLAVLIDRGHREYPIRADFLGRHIPTTLKERVIVQIEPEVAVYLDE